MLKIINKHFRYRWDKYYSQNRWHLILDLSLSTIIIILISLIVGLSFYRPTLNPNNSNKTPLINISINLNNPPLRIVSSINDSSFKLKDGVNLKLNLKNNSGYPLKNIKLNLNILDKNFSLDRVELIDNKNGEIFMATEELNLINLDANSKQEINLKVYFKNNNPDNRELSWELESAYIVNGQDIQGSIDLPILRLAANLLVDLRAYYNSPQGDQLGAGPLPPLVGLPTNYWVFLEIKADGDFKNFIYSAKLPAGIEITENRSILYGTFSYNKDSRQIIWRVPEVKANSSDYRAGFEVQLIPNIKQVDKVLPFFSTSHYSAEEVGAEKTKISEDIAGPDTSLEYDLINTGQGKVSN